MQSTITTARLTLNLLTVDDYEFIEAIVNTKGWIEFIGDRNVHSKEDAIAYIQKVNATKNLTYWVAKVTATNTPIGIISFIKRTYLEHFDIGFAFLPEFNGQGYAYEAAKEVLSIAEKNPAYYPVLATTIPHNVRSIQLLTKLGLHFEKEIQVEQDKLLVYSNAIAPV
ncbi:GNAT family N-acetyltransferase [Ferruginibacter sp. SUN106]|uniref:GNAT family N-acetyltransferase n=1 Tax=Ferruginibacter sp. SUN106 TaxID=2978348 RepID=UPI003D3624FB